MVDHVRPQDSRPEGVVFVFDGGLLDDLLGAGGLVDDLTVYRLGPDHFMMSMPEAAVTPVDGSPIQSTGELVRILRNNRPGGTVQVTVRSTNQRGIPGSPRVLTVRLAEAPVIDR
mgnify:CR=1 FL=1